MRRAQRATSTVSTLQLVGVAALVVLALIAAAVLWAPRKPEAPATSNLSYQKRPEKKVQQADVEIPSELPRFGRTNSPRANVKQATPAVDAASLKFQISGHVTDARTQAPVPGAQVKIARISNDAERSEWEQRRREAAKSKDEEALSALKQQREQLDWKTETGANDKGEFTVGIGHPGEYRVEVYSTKYIPSSQTSSRLDDAQPQAVVDVALSTGASISGRVIEEASNTPAKDVVIVVEQRPDLRAISDEQGNYELSGLAVGNYGVGADLSRTNYTSATTLAYKKVNIAAQDQAVRGVDFTVAAAGLVWGYVLTPDKQPVQGVDVALCTSDSPLTQVLTAAIKQAPPLNDKSQADGYYELNGVPLNQEWRVYANSDKQPPQLADPFVLTSTAREARIDLFLFPGSLVRGRVVDTKGNGIAGADINCLPSYSKLFSPLEGAQAFRNAKSDAQGNFEISQLPAGNYQVMAQKKGFKFSAMGEPLYPDGYSPIENFVLKLEPIDSGNNSIFGTVADAAGSPVSGAQVSVRGVGSQSFDQVALNSSTGPDGSFRFDSVETGAYSLNVSKEGYAPRRSGGVRLNAENIVVLNAAGVVRGRVLARETNAPPKTASFEIAALAVSAETGQPSFASMVEGGQTPAQSFNDPQGRFEIYVPEGYYQLEARAESYAPGHETIQVAQGQVTDNVTLYVSGGGRIAGHVIADDGNSPQGATVAAVLSHQMAQAMVMLAANSLPPNQMYRVGEDGMFELKGLGPGDWVVLAQHRSYAAARTTVTLEERGNVDGVELHLGTGGAVRGIVVKDRQPLYNVTVVATGQDGSTKTATTAADGSYRIDSLGAGSYQLVVLPLTGGTLDLTGGASATIEIVEGQEIVHNFGGGPKLIGTCAPPPPPVFMLIGGAAVLRPPGPPLMQAGGDIPMDQLLRNQYAPIDTLGQFTIQDVTQGDWQVEIYYPSGGRGLLRLVAVEPVSFQGNDDMRVNITVSTAQ